MSLALEATATQLRVRDSDISMAAPRRHSRASGTVRTVRGTFEALERTLQVLLSPLDYPDWRSWRREAHERLLELTGAERLAIYTPLGSDAEAWCAPGMTAEWAATPEPGSGAPGVFRRLSGVFSAQADRADAGPPRFESAAVLAGRPHRASAAVTLASPAAPQLPRPEISAVEVDFGGRRPAVLAFSDGQRHWWRPDAERVASLRAVLPALRSGLAAWRRAAEQRGELLRFVDALSDAVILFDRGGTLLHANEAGRALVESEAGSRVRCEGQQVAWAADAAVRRGRSTDGLSRELRLGDESYRLRAVRPPESLSGADGVVLVFVDRATRAPLTDDDLRARFGLTPREVEVTRLVAEGLSNQEIADRLGVSFFTARNHVERLLVKLGVGNRARVAALLNG